MSVGRQPYSAVEMQYMYSCVSKFIVNAALESDYRVVSPTLDKTSFGRACRIVPSERHARLYN